MIRVRKMSCGYMLLRHQNCSSHIWVWFTQNFRLKSRSKQWSSTATRLSFLVAVNHIALPPVHGVQRASWERLFDDLCRKIKSPLQNSSSGGPELSNSQQLFLREFPRYLAIHHTFQCKRPWTTYFSCLDILGAPSWLNYSIDFLDRNAWVRHSNKSQTINPAITRISLPW